MAVTKEKLISVLSGFSTIPLELRIYSSVTFFFITNIQIQGISGATVSPRQPFAKYHHQRCRGQFRSEQQEEETGLGR